MSEQLRAERLRELMSYDPDTGYFTWRVSIGAQAAGARVATTKNSVGYCRASIDQRRYQQHRLAWLWMTGAWPLQQIDHINGIRTDNRWVNLQDVSSRENTLRGTSPVAMNARKTHCPRGHPLVVMAHQRRRSCRECTIRSQG